MAIALLEWISLDVAQCTPKGKAKWKPRPCGSRKDAVI